MLPFVWAIRIRLVTSVRIRRSARGTINSVTVFGRNNKWSLTILKYCVDAISKMVKATSLPRKNGFIIGLRRKSLITVAVPSVRIDGPLVKAQKKKMAIISVVYCGL